MEQETIFDKYDSISTNSKIKKLNFTFKKSLTKAGKPADSDVLLKQYKWVCSEKIHGSNFSFIVNSQGIQCAKRTGIIKPDEKFYNYQSVLNKYKDSIQKLYQLVQKDHPKIIQIQIYGELFGGKYVSKIPEITEQINKLSLSNKDPNSLKVQDEVQYCLNNDYSAFDIKLFFEDSKKNTLLDYKQTENYFKNSGMNYVKPYKTGTLEELLEIEVETIESELYKEYNLPKLENNIIEGIVIRPYDACHSPLIKKKGEGFKEKHQVPKEKKIEKTKNQQMRLELESYICKNRLVSMLSKFSEDDLKSDLSGFLDQFYKDALKDFLEEKEENKTWYEEYMKSENHLHQQLKEAATHEYNVYKKEQQKK